MIDFDFQLKKEKTFQIIKKMKIIDLIKSMMKIKMILKR
jgi:hypothetical protein